MKKTAILYFLILIFFFSILPISASAEGTDEDLNWDTIVNQFLAENRCRDDSVAVGYYNTVTGEEHFYRGDEYMETGSTYKIPLNMVYAEKIFKGEMDFDTQIGLRKYQYLQQQTIVYSNNDYATLLWQNIGKNDEYGNYKAFRTAIAPYMGVDPDNVDPIYYENRFFTAEQVMHCLKTLYSEPERFPGVIDCMLLAEQDNYFCYHPQNYPVAHKYGYIFENGCLYICDSGICYTDDPIIIVMFTANAHHPNSMLADYCTLMCDYAQITRSARLSLNETLSESSVTSSENTVLSPTLTSKMPDSAQRPDLSDSKENSAVMPTIVICTLFLVATTLVIIFSVSGKMMPISGFLSVLFATSALVLCLIGTVSGTIIARTEGNPRDTVKAFFDSIVSGDYDTACNYLSDYSDFCLDIATKDECSAKMIEALRSSYAYELLDDCNTDGLSARQNVKFRYLDFSKMSEDLHNNTNECIRIMVERLSKKEIYDESGEYLDSFIAEAYAEAVETTLSHKEKYFSYALLDLDLVYRNGLWLMSTSPELLTALSGGV